MVSYAQKIEIRKRWLTKEKKGGILKKPSEEGGRESESVQKKLEKSFKKVLTSEARGDIIYRLSQGSEAP